MAVRPIAVTRPNASKTNDRSVVGAVEPLTKGPREIGTVVAFFASDEASYLTGQSIHVDGGWVGK